MKNIMVSQKLSRLKVQAERRKAIMPHNKSSQDVRIENQNFIDLENIVYNQIGRIET